MEVLSFAAAHAVWRGRDGRALRPLRGRLGDDGEGVYPGRELVGERAVHHAVAIDQLRTLECGGHDHHLEVCLRAAWDVVAVALVEHLEVQGRDAAASFCAIDAATGPGAGAAAAAAADDMTRMARRASPRGAAVTSSAAEQPR
eukprot:CAMPEP_0179996830 /NCGR_PEP_ID=MMETSP0984-20121128/7812_1 /TAXON_ID=483367 /ORGANISM="non described non described, Strain CCMP 2436" /LENGTH=143 /DNA_ID=CAMNT_0021916383 /DNA_START=32 /DNA_END=461 /DNA_ORIENTATION=+